MATIKDLREWMKDLSGEIEIVEEGIEPDCGASYLAFDFFTVRHEFFIHATEHHDYPNGRFYFTGYRRAEIAAKQSHDYVCYEHGGPLTRETWEQFLHDIEIMGLPGTPAQANRLWDKAIPIDSFVGRYLEEYVESQLEEHEIGPEGFRLDAEKYATGLRSLTDQAVGEVMGQALHGSYVYCQESTKMIAAIRDQNGDITAVKLAEPYDDWDIPIVGSLGDGAVQLAMPREVLGLAVSVEAALQVYQQFGIPTWAVVDPDRFGSVSVPPAVSEIRIFPDDGFGAMVKATVAAKKFTDQGIKAIVEWLTVSSKPG